MSFCKMSARTMHSSVFLKFRNGGYLYWEVRYSSSYIHVLFNSKGFITEQGKMVQFTVFKITFLNLFIFAGCFQKAGYLPVIL